MKPIESILWMDAVFAHDKPNRASFDAYRSRHELTDEQILERMLVLNLESAVGQASAPVQSDEGTLEV